MKDVDRCMKGVVLLLSIVSCLAHAQQEADRLGSSDYRNSAIYESGRSTGDRMGFTGPERTGRPGITYFEKGAKAFEKDQYAFAIDMYTVSASWAYKPAQHNLSVMYAKGDGVPVDMPRAMAWAALAAERGEKRYVRARDAINIELSTGQVDEANRILEELKPKFADPTALLKAKRRWRDAKQGATGSKLGSVGNVKVGAGGSSLTSTSPGLVMTNAWEITGGKQNDGSREYRQLQQSDNPYDPKDRVAGGTVTVGEIKPIPDLSAGRSAPVISTEVPGKQ